jgi:hypothetical protein
LANSSVDACAVNVEPMALSPELIFMFRGKRRRRGLPAAR